MQESWRGGDGGEEEGRWGEEEIVGAGGGGEGGVSAWSICMNHRAFA